MCKRLTSLFLTLGMMLARHYVQVLGTSKNQIWCLVWAKNNAKFHNKIIKMYVKAMYMYYLLAKLLSNSARSGKPADNPIPQKFCYSLFGLRHRHLFLL